MDLGSSGLLVEWRLRWSDRTRSATPILGRAPAKAEIGGIRINKKDRTRARMSLRELVEFFAGELDCLGYWSDFTLPVLYRAAIYPEFLCRLKLVISK
jgi:hypothetical protein